MGQLSSKRPEPPYKDEHSIGFAYPGIEEFEKEVLSLSDKYKKANDGRYLNVEEGENIISRKISELGKYKYSDMFEKGVLSLKGIYSEAVPNIRDLNLGVNSKHKNKYKKRKL